MLTLLISIFVGTGNVCTLLEDIDGKQNEMIKLLTREPSQRFKEVFGGESFVYVLLYWANDTYVGRRPFLEGFDSKLKEDASLIYSKMIGDSDLYGALCGTSRRETVRERWLKWFERPRNKWGNSPLEKALANIFIPFLSVTCEKHAHPFAQLTLKII